MRGKEVVKAGGPAVNELYFLYGKIDLSTTPLNSNRERVGEDSVHDGTASQAELCRLLERVVEGSILPYKN